MEIWLARHGRTGLNNQRLMQGHLDEPLDDTGRAQARQTRRMIGEVRFDAVYSSPLIRAEETAAIIGGVGTDEIIIDSRLIEVDFGPYEGCSYNRLGPAMSLYWALPEIFPAPRGVETVQAMVARASSFLEDLRQKDYGRVLVTSHGGILRALNGCLAGRRNGLMWRPRMRNCEIRVYACEPDGGRYRLLRRYLRSGG